MLTNKDYIKKYKGSKCPYCESDEIVSRFDQAKVLAPNEFSLESMCTECQRRWAEYYTLTSVYIPK